MKKNKFIWIIVGVILIGLIIYFVTRKEKEFNTLSFPITNVVMNKTSQNYLTSIINAGLHELNIDSVYIIVLPMPSSLKENGLGDSTFELLATLVGNKTQFTLYVNEMNRLEAINVISHELIHLNQYHSGRLIKREGINSVIWDGNIYDVTKISYLDRLWEKDAFSKDKDLGNKIRNLLLN
jgi:hypothetical protein